MNSYQGIPPHVAEQMKMQEQHMKMQGIGSVLGSIQAAPPRVSLIDQICRAHDAMDRLYSLARELENRLGAVLDSEPPTQEGNCQTAGCEPPALSEMDRLITRIHATADYIDRIHARTRL
jgi:hypothetical protein